MEISSSILNSMTAGKLKEKLDRLYEKYNHHGLIKPDPLQFVYRYANPADKEVAAFLSAVLAYGRVKQIQKSLEHLLSLMPTGPYAFVMSLNNRKKVLLKDFKHRFNTGKDIYDLLNLLKLALQQYGSIEELFLQGYKADDENIIAALSTFCTSLRQFHAQSNNNQIPKSLAYLIPSPVAGSACKRLNLFLRWMVRKDGVDTGLWKEIDKRKLLVPVDVHMNRLCRILGLHKRKTVSLSTAIEVTNSFAKIEPQDPVKYDFALSRIGIVENCTGRYSKHCELCELYPFCCK
jgi:uncharacterized protein (TIGR02757 family)